MKHLFLYIALVDPGRITIPLCDDPDVLGHGSQFGNVEHQFCSQINITYDESVYFSACGVLTLTINGGFDGPLTGRISFAHQEKCTRWMTVSILHAIR